MLPSYIIPYPGMETWEENRAWQGCPTIARTKGGRLFAGWYTGGMFEPCIENYNVLVMSDDNGDTWSHPVLAVTSDTEKRMRNIDIQLWVDPYNRLWVMYTRSPYSAASHPASIRTHQPIDYHREFIGVELLMCEDPDADVLKWSDPRVICYGFLRCKPVILSDGRWIFPAYDWLHSDRYYLRVSSDEGKTFTDLPASQKLGPKTYDETMLWETLDGRLRYLVRTNTGVIGISESCDGGVTWSETTSFQRAPSARFYISRLKSGRLCLVRSISETSRTGMKICLSEDDGVTWPWELVLDDRTSVSYPDLCEDDDGNLLIVHDRERDNTIKLNRETWHSDAAKEILISRVTESDIISGKPCSGSYISHILSKALIDDVAR